MRMGPAPDQHTYFSFLKLGDLCDYTHRKGSLRLKGSDANKPIGFLSRIHLFLLRDATHMEGSWDIPDSGSEPANQNNWPKENQEKCPIKVIQHKGATRFSSECPMHHPNHIVAFFSLNKHLLRYFPSFVSLQSRPGLLVPDCWSCG